MGLQKRGLLDKHAAEAAAALAHLTEAASTADMALGLRNVNEQLRSVRQELATVGQTFQLAQTRITSLEGDFLKAAKEIRALRSGADDTGKGINTLQLEAVALRKEIGECESRIRRELAPLRKQLEGVEQSY